MYGRLVTAGPGPAPTSSGCGVIIKHIITQIMTPSWFFRCIFSVFQDTTHHIIITSSSSHHIRGRGCFYRSVLRVVSHVAMETKTRLGLHSLCSHLDAPGQKCVNIWYCFGIVIPHQKAHFWTGVIIADPVTLKHIQKKSIKADFLYSKFKH